MKKSLISLSRNKTNKNINMFLSASGKENGEEINEINEKNSIFKTTQEESKTIPKLMKNYVRGLNKKQVNIIFSVKNYDKYIKTKYMSDISTKFLLIDDSDSKLTSPISNTIRYNHSIQRFKHNNYTIRKYKGSTSYSGYNLIKLNKPYLLKLLSKDIIDKTLHLKDSSLKSLSPSTNYQTINSFNLKQNKIYDYNNTINNENIHINKFSSKKKDKMYNLKALYEHNKNNYMENTPRIYTKPFKKFSKINVNFPLEFPNSISVDKMELRDKVNVDYYNNENIKKQIKKTLFYDLNSYDYDNGIYSEYKNSIPNYINFIYDINILPHIKNKFLYAKPIGKQTQINDIIFNRNVIRKEVARGINRYIINNIRKDILEKEEIKRREKKMRELAKTNRIMLKLYLERKDEDMPNLTSDEMVELTDYFGKNIDYKCVCIPNNKLRNVVYDENNFFKKKNKNK